VAIVDVLHRSGVAGASVLLGVDGTVGGTRRRARTVGANARVPAMIVAVGDEESITAALPEIAALEPSREGVAPLITLERVRVCKRDGVPLTDPQDLPATDAAGLGVWQKLTVYSGEQSRHRGRPLHDELVGALRGAGAAGATVLRGVWGYHGDHHPHGDHLLQLRRRVPVVTTIVDAPERARRWFAVVDEVTDETGLVTSEVVPALRVAAGGTTTGGLRLARPPGGPAAAGPP
jgi:PII-like signaling protein